MLTAPGAMEAGLASPICRGSLAAALAGAFAVTAPVHGSSSRVARHAVVHALHQHN